jgi:FKBP-type peptidyl-prolyl cis-trans isomerase
MRLPFFVFIAFALLWPMAAHAQREKFSMEDIDIITREWPKAQRTVTGLRSLVLSPGAGLKPQPGDDVGVIYTGRLLDGKVFDQYQDKTKPFVFRVGRHEVIPGWDEGLQLMQVGERRLLIVPYELAYGTRGRPPRIPRAAALVFEVELLSLNTPPALAGP